MQRNLAPSPAISNITSRCICRVTPTGSTSKSWENVAFADDRFWMDLHFQTSFLDENFLIRPRFVAFVRHAERLSFVTARSTWLTRSFTSMVSHYPMREVLRTVRTSTSTTRFFLLFFSSSSPFFKKLARYVPSRAHHRQPYEISCRARTAVSESY